MSRDHLKRSGSSTTAAKASAVSWPTPGIVISRRHASDALTIFFMSASIATTASPGRPRRRLPISRPASAHTYQARAPLTPHKPDQNAERGSAHLAGKGFLKPVHVKSLPTNPRKRRHLYNRNLTPTTPLHTG